MCKCIVPGRVNENAQHLCVSSERTGLHYACLVKIVSHASMSTKTCVLSRECKVVAESVGYGAQDKSCERAWQSARRDAAGFCSHGLRGEHTRPHS